MIGETLSHYRIISKLGQGGMGVIFLAEDISLARKVAIKVLPDNFRLDDIARKRFLREARLASALDHPYICSIHELLDVDGRNYIVMEFVEGQTLRERLAQGPLPRHEAIRAGLEIAEALEKAHQNGIIHRDLKPANIMLTAEGHVKVMDFGLAKHVESAEPLEKAETRSTLTRYGVTAGTLEYMSPEQLQGQALTPESDLFALGVVLCEMLTGIHPFRKDLELECAHAIVHAAPLASAFPSGSPDELHHLLHALLSKDPRERGSVHDVRTRLARLIQQAATEAPLVSGALMLRVRRTLARRAVGGPALVAILGLSYFGYRRVEHDRKVTWARDVALPEIARLTESGEALAAFNLATEAEAYLPEGARALDKFRPLFSRTATITSDPPGATVWWKDYRAQDSEWKLLGQTPVKGMSVPAIFCTVRIEKQGYQPVVVATRLTEELSLSLEKAGSLPKDMVRVPASVFRLALPGLDHLKEQPLGAFLIDTYEVTNRAYKRFVDDGGYRVRKYWTQPFVMDGRMLSWEEAIDRFKDRTGRTGPATWEAGDYPEGHDDYPVSGVSWYEAAAYAEYVGKSLPTIYHWYTPAGMPSSADIVPLSNLGVGASPARIGAFRGLGPFGTYDMAGNVREWCRNSSSEGQRFILGGGWDDPVYAFDSDAYTQPPFDRSASNGFRCIKSLGAPEVEAAAARTIGRSFREFFKEKPSSDQEFGVFRRQYAYDRTPLNVEIIAKDTSAEWWVREKVSFDAAYANERVLAYLFLPTNMAPPYQVVFHWPGDSGLHLRSSDNSLLMRNFDFIIKSGRAVLVPVFKSMFERGDGLESTVPNETNRFKEHVIMWVKDVRRSLDYLQTRPDIDATKLAFFGHSWGGRMSSIALAVDNRFKVAVLYVAGFRFPRSMPEVDPFNFVPRVTIPVLMLNGRYDHYFPVETAQKPMFTLLGTRNEDKKWIVYDGGHFVPRDQLIKETLTWLDRYLGNPK